MFSSRFRNYLFRRRRRPGEGVEEEENLYFSKCELRELALVEIYFKQIPELHKFRTTVRPDVFSGGCTAAEHYFSTIQ